MKYELKKSIEINAPKEQVWDVLINDKFTRLWYAEFSEGTYAETDWTVGGKAVFKDNSQSGIVGEIIANKPNEVLSLEYKGVVKDGKEDYESEEAESVKGGHETYLLSEKNGVTDLSIECDTSDAYLATMEPMWDKALQKIKSLSESL